MTMHDEPFDPAGRAAGPDCPLCAGEGGHLVWRDDRLRVVLADEPDFPGFTRVVWHDHVAEMTDLAPAGREHLMAVVWQVEAAQREALAAHKVNLASLGNVVPHLHWHVIARWPDDSHFPAPIWAPPAGGRPDRLVRACRQAARARLPRYLDLLGERLAGVR